jgi:release factor glutamine methyltransferase
VVAEAPEWLAPDGRVLVETSPAQSGVLAAHVAAAGLAATTSGDADVDGHVVIGSRR